MKTIIRIILIITITGLSACSSKQEVVKEKKISEPDMEQASALNVQLALGYIEREQLGIAQEKLEKAIEQNPKRVDAFTTMAYLKRPINEYNMDPFYETPYLAYANAGTCLLDKGDYKQAEVMLRKALRDQPNYAGALISMAEIGVKTHKYLMARAYIQRYHALAKPSAESLWLQVQAEKALGAEDHYLKYARQLLKEFPDSDQAGMLEEMSRNERIRE